MTKKKGAGQGASIKNFRPTEYHSFRAPYSREAHSVELANRKADRAISTHVDLEGQLGFWLAASGASLK